MSIVLITNPTATQPASVTDYQSILNVILACSQGNAPIGITEFDNTTTIPKIKENAVFCCYGSWYRADSDTTISGSIATGDNYIRLSPTIAYWTQDDPEWNYQYNHYEDTTNSDYVLPIKIVYDGASEYLKYEIQDRFLTEFIDYSGNKITEALVNPVVSGDIEVSSDIDIGGNILVTNSPTDKTFNLITTGATGTFERGIYYLYAFTAASFTVSSGGVTLTTPTVVISDGSSVITNTYTTTNTVIYKKF